MISFDFFVELQDLESVVQSQILRQLLFTELDQTLDVVLVRNQQETVKSKQKLVTKDF